MITVENVARGGATHIGLAVHGGAGAWSRVHAIVRHLRAHVSVLSPHPPPFPLPDAVDIVRLPAPTPADGPGDAVPGADLGHEAQAALRDWLGAHAPDLMVVDGVPGVVSLARSVGLPVVPLRTFGVPSAAEAAELQRSAAAWLAPYPAVLEPDDTPADVRLRTVYTGFLSRTEGRGMGRSAARRRLGIEREARYATIMVGPSDAPIPRSRIEAAAAAAERWSFSVVGRVSLGDRVGDASAATASPNDAQRRVRFEGWRADPFLHLAAADVVICGPSLGSVADVAAVQRPFALMLDAAADTAEVRLAEALERAGAAAVLDRWPEPMAWPALLAELLDQEPGQLRRLVDGRAGRRAADWIGAWASTPPAADPGAPADAREGASVGRPGRRLTAPVKGSRGRLGVAAES